jgi:hypothetical protein
MPSTRLVRYSFGPGLRVDVMACQTSHSITATEVSLLISEPMPQIFANTDRFKTERFSFWGRFSAISLTLLIAGWLWPYDVTTLPGQLNNTGWVLGWFTVLVLLGAVAGYALRTRWSILIAPLVLYIGGVVHWFQFEWGLVTPPWPMFALVSGLAIAVLLITSGAAAGIASRVVSAERERGRPAEGIRQSAALAALLGLIAMTSIYVLPTPFLGALLGLGALLSGLGLMEEEHVNAREAILAMSGMLIGVLAIGTQLYSLWSFVRDIPIG